MGRKGRLDRLLAAVLLGVELVQHLVRLGVLRVQALHRGRLLLLLRKTWLACV